MNRICANARLSGRETEVLRLLGNGKTTLEIPPAVAIVRRVGSAHERGVVLSVLRERRTFPERFVGVPTAATELVSPIFDPLVLITRWICVRCAPKIECWIVTNAPAWIRSLSGRITVRISKRVANAGVRSRRVWTEHVWSQCRTHVVFCIRRSRCSWIAV